MIRPIALLVVAAVAAAGSTARAQATARPTAQTLYEEALALEHVLRGDLDVPGPDASLASRLRRVVAAYEAVVLRFPRSGYCDNALWQAAGLAGEAVQRWNQDRDRATERRLLVWLVSEYPSSPFVPRAREQLARSKASQAPPESGASPARTDRTPGGTPASPGASPATIAELRAIRRTVLADVVRVTIEFDREVPAATERLDNPSRVLFDFTPSRLSAAVVGGVLNYSDDVVRQIRIGERPPQAIRVVLDLEGVKAYSTHVTYNPYRLVVDCERGAAPSPGRPELSPQRAPAPKPPLAGAAWGPLILSLPVAVPSNPLVREAERPAAMTSAAPPPSPGAASAGTAPAGRPGETPTPPAANIGGGYSLARQLGLGVARIVIDPGHGGHDPGAQGGGTSEASVVLDVALRLEKLLAQDAGAEVVLTRRTDTYVGLEERTAIANRAQADLFLSIHVNANRNHDVSGAESYFLNFASSPDAASVAARENAAAGMNMGSLPDVVKAIALSSKVNESRDFATIVQQALVRGLRSTNRNVKDLGVKQAPFVVLLGAAMPSVLVEVSFITNGQEARLLRDAAYRQRIAAALADAVHRYQKSLKTGRPIEPQ